jgi:hypothetical protein
MAFELFKWSESAPPLRDCRSMSGGMPDLQEGLRKPLILKTLVLFRRKDRQDVFIQEVGSHAA